MRPCKRTLWLGLVLCLAAAGCSSTYRNCIRLHTGGGREGIAAEQCDRECRRGHGEGDYEYLRCLAACPGAQVSQNDTCGPQDLQPGVVCRVTDLRLEDTPAATTADDTGSRVLAGVGWFALEALASAITSRSSSSDSSSSDSSASTSQAARSSPRTPASKPHKPAEPASRRSHTPAKARSN